MVKHAANADLVNDSEELLELTSERSNKRQVFIIEGICFVSGSCLFQPKISQLPTEISHCTSLLSMRSAVSQIARLISCIYQIRIVLCSNDTTVATISTALCKSLMNTPCKVSGIL